MHYDRHYRTGVFDIDTTKYPTAPLFGAVGNPSQVALARSVGYPVKTVSRWCLGDGLPWIHADRVAVRLGMHPAEIWPQWANHNAEQPQGTNA